MNKTLNASQRIHCTGFTEVYRRKTLGETIASAVYFLAAIFGIDRLRFYESINFCFVIVLADRITVANMWVET